MSAATPAELARLSDEVARDPRSLAFHPLAAAYLAGGRTAAALRLCLRGLEQHPEHVEAHVLLGRIYLAQGEALKAFDEFDIALRLDAEHPAARREIGLLALERREWEAAERHLERALRQRPDDAALAEALERARARGTAPAPPPATAPTAVPAAAEGPEGPFAARFERGIRGAVLMDARGRQLAGALEVDGRDRADELAAALSGASDEAGRVLAHLGLGEWRTMLLETPAASVHLAPIGEAMIAVAAERSAPPGWVVRQAGRLRAAAARWLEADGGGA